GGNPGPAQIAALQLVREVEPRSATKEFLKLLPRLDAAVQVALIGGLAQRGDPESAGGIARLVKAGAPDVRVAALKALGALGDDQAVPVLAQAAAMRNPNEQNAARRSLVLIQRGKVTEKLLAELATTTPEVQTELARALGERGDPAAI